jgi:DNA-binding transcriptional MerR regulator
LGADATIETIALRTGHSVKAVRAKLARLDYRADDIHGVTVFTIDEIAELLGATPRQIRRWKERGWLATKNRRVAEDGLERFVQEHADLIPFNTLAREDQIYLLDLGYPVPERKQFRQNVREVLDGIGRQRKKRRPTRRSSDDVGKDAAADKPPEDTDRKLSQAG